jgi:hypothetical protein
MSTTRNDHYPIMHVRTKDGVYCLECARHPDVLASAWGTRWTDRDPGHPLTCTRCGGRIDSLGRAQTRARPRPSHTREEITR